MQGENVRIRFILTVMALVVFWGVNTSAIVINQWMAKTVAPQLLAMEKKTGGFEVELLGYRFDWREKDWAEFINTGESLIPQAKALLQEFISLSEVLINKGLTYWHQIKCKLFFKGVPWGQMSKIKQSL